MKNIAQAIINIMTEVKNIEKKTNVGTGSASYKAIGDSMVRNELKESMVKNGLVIVPISIQATTKSYMQIDHALTENNNEGRNDATTNFALRHGYLASSTKRHFTAQAPIQLTLILLFLQKQ